MIDENIIINKSDLPKIIIDCINKLEYYEKINDEDMYYATLDILETMAKSYVIVNKLSEKEYNTILRKYGGEV